MNSFQLIGLPMAPFSHLFALPDEQLAALHVQRVIASESPGYPCRVSLTDAAVGEELLLLSYAHQCGASPYKASGPIFVRRGAAQRRAAVGELPDYVRSRLISVRAYDAAHGMVDAAVCEGSQLAPQIERLFAHDHVAYLHLHNAKRGCFSCRVDRAEGQAGAEWGADTNR